MESLYFIVALLLMIAGSPSSSAMPYDIKDYRLITKDRPNVGIVGVYTEEAEWRLICMPRNWNFELASAVCENLNFPGTSRYLNAGHLGADGDEWLTSVTNNISVYYHSCSIPGRDGQMDMRCKSYAGTCDKDSIAAVTCKEPGYLGCFVDYNRYGLGRDRVLSKGLDDIDELTIDKCVNICRGGGFFYAGVEYQDECFCGRQNEHYNKYGMVSDEDCNEYHCPGDDLEECGGSDRIAIYLTGLDICDDPGSPANGFMSVDSHPYDVGSKVFFNCSDGFFLEGPDVIQCVETYVNISSAFAVIWNDSLPNCTEISSMASSTVATQTGAVAISKTFLGTADTMKLEGDMNIIYISIGIVLAIIIIVVVIITLVIHKRHNKRNAARLGADGHDTDNNVASRNAGSGGGIPLMPRHDDEDLFELSALASRSSTAEGNHYDNEGGPQTLPGSADISSNTREGFGYESIRLPAESSPLEGGVSVGGATDLYANTDYHKVPSNMIENELYG